MFLLTANPACQLLLFTFIGKVTAEELIATRPNLIQLLQEMKPGFRLLSDMTQLESFDEGCPAEIGRNMTLLGQHGVGVVVRVIPDSSKDFGLNILAVFHYANHPQTVVCKTMIQAAKALAL